MIKWAIQGGNWSDTTTWNDGVVPTVNDVVYCNGYSIVLDVDGVAGTISNDENPTTLRRGGQIYVNTIRTLTANIIGVNAYPINYYVSSTNNTQTIIGNINLTGTYINWNARGGYPNCTINGNIVLNNGSEIFNYVSANPPTNVINGNITVNNGCRLFSTNNNFTLNGTLIFNEGSSNLTALKVNGIFENHITLSQTLSINGEIKNYGQLMGDVTFTGDAILKYYGVDDSMGLACSSITFQSPNSIQFIKMNVADYPQPEDVRKNIIYDFGRKVGEMEQEINNTNTINVYPYAKRVI